MKKTIFIMLLSLFSVLLLADVVTIAEIQENVEDYDGQEVTIEAVVTIGAGITNTSLLNVFVQDDSGKGILLFDYDIPEETILVRGNKLEVTGTVEEFEGTTEIKDFTATLLEENVEIPFVELSVSEAQNFAVWEGTFLAATGVINEIYTNAGGGDNITIEDESGNEITVRKWNSTGIDISNLSVGLEITVKGVSDSYNNYAQIVPGYQDDISLGVISDITFSSESIVSGAAYPNTEEEINVEVIAGLDDIVVGEVKLSLMKNDISIYEENDQTPEDETNFQFTIPKLSSLDATEGTYNLVITATDTESTEYTKEKEIIIIEAEEELSKNLQITKRPFNPFVGDEISITYKTKTNTKIILRIYDSEGKLVYTPLNRTFNLDSESILLWDGKDKNREIVSLGLYVCHYECKNLTTGNTTTEIAPLVVADKL